MARGAPICNLISGQQDACSFTLDAINFQLNDDGEILFQQHGKTHQIKVKLPEYFEFDVVRHAEIVGHLVFFNIEMTDMEFGGALVFVIDRIFGKLVWQTEIPTFNSSKLLIQDNAVYVAGIGYVAKLDARTGKKIWQIDSLYEVDTQAFRSFKKPFLLGENVIFQERKASTEKHLGERSVVVHNQTGNLVSKVAQVTTNEK